MNIAVYSGSFNPLHIGHLAIIRYLIAEGGFDCVYLIVSPKNPLKDTLTADSGYARYQAAISAVERHFTSGVQVDDIELNMPAPHYTIKTLDALKEREPENRFTLVMGADNLSDIHRWRDYSRILKEFGTAVYPRIGFNLEAIKSSLLEEDPSFRIILMNAEMVDISSTTIRNAIAEGQDMSNWLM